MIINNFKVSVWFSILFAVSFSATAFALSGLVFAIIAAGIAFACCYGTLKKAFEERQNKNALKKPADTLAVIGMMAFLVTTVSFNIVFGLIVLLYFLQLALNLSFREHRQVYFGVMVCFIALMMGAVFSRHEGFLFFMLLFIIVGGFYLAAIHIDKYTPENQQHDYGKITKNEYAVSVFLLSIIGLFIYLAIPRFPAGNLGGINLKGWGKYHEMSKDEKLYSENEDLTKHFDKLLADSDKKGDSNKPDESVGSKPKTNGGNPKATNDKSGVTNNDAVGKNISADSDNYQYNSDEEKANQEIAKISQDNRIYFYVKSSHPLYLREQVKTYFNGKSWFAAQHGFKELKQNQDNHQFILYDANPNQHAEISVVLDTPVTILDTISTVAVDFPTDKMGRDYYDILKISDTLKKGTVYELAQFDDFQKSMLFDSYRALPNDYDTQLPNNLDPRIAKLADKITENYKSSLQKSLALEYYLRSNYRYTLDTIQNQNNIPIADFLFDSKAGHCEYFATSLAIMLRTQKIPARMVLGFAAQEYNPMTGLYEVKGSNAHAWVEAYIDNAWTTLEATPAYNAEKPSQDLQKFQITNDQVKKYLKELKTHNQLTQKSISVKEVMLLTWYEIIVGFDYLGKTVVWLVWHLGLVAVFIFALWFFKRKEIENYYSKIKDYLALRRLRSYKITNQLVDVAYYLGQIQALLNRHGIVRYNGMTIEEFTNLLITDNNLITPKDAEYLQLLIDKHYYQEETYNKTDREYFIALYERLRKRL